MDRSEHQASQSRAAQIRGDARRSNLTGRNLGVYQVEALIGAGAMGEVYRARDNEARAHRGKQGTP